jgi:hypothetical protein
MTMEQYEIFFTSAKEFEDEDHYKKLLCLKNVPTKISYSCEIPNLSTPWFDDWKGFIEKRPEITHACVLPKGHDGNCKYTYSFLTSSKKLNGSVNNCIYTTPGNDDFIYKNRATRLLKNVMSGVHERDAKNKNIKLKCCIPLEDSSKPYLLAQAYLDWVTFIVKTDGNNLNPPKYLKDLFDEHAEFLDQYFKEKERKIFDDDGHTICPVTHEKLEISNWVDTERDNRTVIKDSDVQMGHCEPRNSNRPTIRGLNLVPMTRTGNRLVGDNNFMESKWIDDLKRIVKNF